MLPIKRRSLIQHVAAWSSGALVLARSAESKTPPVEFLHGVASGDPDHHSIVIWTRVSGSDEPVEVYWEVATNPDFKDIVVHGRTTTTRYRDHTVKALAAGLRAGSTYYYRFRANNQVSVTGRMRTLPKGQLDHLGLALVSCSNFAFGYFNPYDAIANDSDIDFVLHLGDYIYEYGRNGWGGDTASKLGREHEPPHEIVTLSDYRQRHAQYKTDLGSQAMHAAHPILLVWDDHESTNNPWLNGAQNHQEPSEGLWRDRRDAALRAYYEWMPLREPEIDEPREKLWRHFQFGTLATLTTLETRHTGRAKQIDYRDHIENIHTQTDAEWFKDEILAKPNRTMLSQEMESFLAIKVKESVEEQIPWRLIGNPVPIANMPVPNLAEHGIELPNQQAAVDSANPNLLWKGRFNLPFYLDTWDGYPWARERFYNLCAASGATDLIVLTGDSHSFWSNTLQDGAKRQMGVEIGTAGVSSPGDFIEQGFDPHTAARIDQIFAEEIEEVRWTDNLHQGYVKLRLSEKAIQTSYIAVSTVSEPAYKVLSIREERITKKGSSVGFVDAQ